MFLCCVGSQSHLDFFYKFLKLLQNRAYYSGTLVKFRELFILIIFPGSLDYALFKGSHHCNV